MKSIAPNRATLHDGLAFFQRDAAGGTLLLGGPVGTVERETVAMAKSPGLLT